jgi:hypothetical protein
MEPLALRIALALAGTIAFGGISIACMFWPRTIQHWVVRLAPYSVEGHIPPLKRYIQSDAYIIRLRMVSVITAIGFLIGLVALVECLQQL